MKQVGIGTALLFVTLTLSCAGAVLIAQGDRGEANDVVRAQLGLCDNSACFMGIQPGKTLWADVKRIVAALPDDEVLRNDNTEVHLIFYDGTHVTLTRKASLKVEAIWLNAYTSQRVSRMLPLSMASLLTQFGAPCAVQANDSFVQVIYPGVYGGLRKLNDRLEPEM